jgi:hypothetical protein
MTSGWQHSAPAATAAAAIAVLPQQEAVTVTSSSDTAAAQQQQLMAVELQSLPAAVAPHLNLNLSLCDPRVQGMASAGFSSLDTLNLNHPYGGSASMEAAQVAGSHASQISSSSSVATAAGLAAAQQQQRSSVAGASPVSSALTSPRISCTSPTQQQQQPNSQMLSLGMQQQQQQQQGDGSARELPIREAAAEPAGPAGSNSSSEVPLLARELGVSVGSLMRLFRADAEAEFEQPVWMVVNLQVRCWGCFHHLLASIRIHESVWW